MLLSDVEQVERGIGDKLAMLFQYVAAFLAGFIVGFTRGWKLTLVILAVSPLLAISGGIMGKVHILGYLNNSVSLIASNSFNYKVY